MQRVLAPDEAVLGYFFLAPTVLLIMMMDRQRFDVERIVFKSEDEMAPVNELWIDGLELATFHLPADVAVLSACNSGQRAVSGRGMSSLPGDDIVGLQSALFQAGVHTVLGGLWTVETQAACAVTSEFHRNYAKGDAVDGLFLGLTRCDDV